MENKKKIGIWMCQSNVQLIEYNNAEPVDMEHIPCLDKKSNNTYEPIIEFSEAQKEEIFRKQIDFKKLADRIGTYDELVIFGPIDAKKEFQTYLETNKFENLPTIEIKQTELMTAAQQVAYVQYHFLHHNRTNA
jgi:hypothetical protein